MSGYVSPYSPSVWVGSELYATSDWHTTATAAPAVDLGWTSSAGEYMFGAFFYGEPMAWGGYRRSFPGFFGLQPAGPAPQTVAALWNLSNAQAPVAAMRAYNDATGYRNEGGALQSQPPGPPPPVGDRVGRLFDTVVRDGKRASEAFSPEERRAIREAEQNQPIEGQHKLLVQFTDGVREWMKDRDGRGRFLSANAKVVDGNPSAQEVFRRKVMNLIDAGTREPDSRVNTFINEMLGRRGAPRGKGDYAYVDALIAQIDALGVRAQVNELSDRSVARAAELGGTLPAAPVEQEVVDTLTAQGYPAALSQAAAAKLAHCDVSLWETIHEQLVEGGKEAAKHVGPAAQQQRYFERLALEVLRVIGFEDTGEGGQRSEIYGLAVVKKGKQIDYQDMAGFIERAERIKSDLNAGKTMEEIRKKYGKGK